MENMGNVLGIIFANMHDNTIGDLVKYRTMGSVLFGGRYRLIDFPLSNMVNSGISEVAVITKKNYQSLLDHLGSAREWDLARKKGGLHILPPFSYNDSGVYRGRLEALSGVMSTILKSNCEYVIMSDCDVVANMNYKKVLEYHIQKGADITMVCNKGLYKMEQTRNSTVVAADEDGRVYDILIDPQISGECNVSLNMFVVSKDLLVQLIQQCITRSQYSFERDVLQAMKDQLKIYTYQYDDYFSRIDGIKSYYQANMDLINPDNSRKLFFRDTPIYTKVSDNAPCKYGLDSKVTSSLIADGCVIEGKVENSVLFRGVKVGKDAVVKNSIIMQNTEIGQKAELNYIITDKNVNIARYRVLNGSLVYPLFVGKGVSL